MINLNLTKGACFMILSLAIAFQTNAQPASKKISEQEAQSKSASGQTLNQASDKTKIEQEYLAKAHQNIEQYRKGDAQLSFVDSKGNPLKKIQVEINQLTQDFLFGNIVWELAGMNSGEPYKIDVFKEKFRQLFNFAIVPFYWSGYELRAGNPDWQRNENAIAWCLENGITVKGHPLSWTSPSGTPGWLLKLKPDVATDLLKARIYDNVIGYKGRINIWDVVNEAANTIPWEMALKDTGNNDNVRYNINGITIDQIALWVENAFNWANTANHDGTYILNEYFTLALPQVRERFYQLIKELQKRNVPVKGIGIQAHEPREMWFSPVEMYKTFDLYKEFNLPIHITEFMPQSSGKDITGWRIGKWTEEAQAEFAEQFYTLAFGYPAVVSINWWGLSDRNIWLKGGGLLDSLYNPKPVYNTLLRLIKQDWMTKNLILSTDKNGMANFRGFYGEYEIVITKPDGSKQTFRKHLEEKANNQWKLILFTETSLKR
jgi:endo-1,4-beta-xylanase